MKPFIDAGEIWDYINTTKPTVSEVRAVIAKSLDKQRLTLAETAVLINADIPELIEEIKDGARRLKEMVYGNRIVLFAPLYIGNKCTNNCSYCGFRSTNKDAIRSTLEDQELVREVEALEDNGQKRLILVYGEHPDYSPEYIAHTVKVVYGVKKRQWRNKACKCKCSTSRNRRIPYSKGFWNRYLSDFSRDLSSRDIYPLSPWR